VQLLFCVWMRESLPSWDIRISISLCTYLLLKTFNNELSPTAKRRVGVRPLCPTPDPCEPTDSAVLLVGTHFKITFCLSYLHVGQIVSINMEFSPGEKTQIQKYRKTYFSLSISVSET